MSAKDQSVDNPHERWLVVPRTLCFITNGQYVLLMKRSPHRRIFPNRFNGIGGHIEKNEDILESLKREILEETGLTVHDIRLIGIHHINAGEPVGVMIFVFTAISNSRDIKQHTDEGTCYWILKTEVLDLSLDLVDDLTFVLPRILETNIPNQPYFAKVSYDQQDDLLIRFSELDM